MSGPSRGAGLPFGESQLTDAMLTVDTALQAAGLNAHVAGINDSYSGSIVSGPSITGDAGLQ